MGTYVLVRTDGTIEKHEGGKKLDLKRIYDLIGCDCVDRVKVRYEGRLRDAYLDDDGLFKVAKTGYNPTLRKMVAEGYDTPLHTVQHFAGHAVIWVPTARHPYAHAQEE